MKARKATSPRPMRGVYYVRVSTDDQVDGTSLDDQERQCSLSFQSNGIELVRAFREEGASAKTADRRVLSDAIAFCLDKRNRIGFFLVWKVDRLARKAEDHFALRKLLQDAGVELQSVTEPIGNDPSGKLFEVMVAGFAEFDNSVRRLRAVNGMRARIREGIWPFKAPVGYRNRSLAKSSVKKTDPDPVDPIVFPILQRLLQGLARGHFSQSQIVEELIRSDFQKLSGTKPSLQFVDNLLRSQLPFYAGLLRDAFGDEVQYHQGRHEPMITLEEMKAIERIRDGGVRHGRARERHNPNFPLRGLVVCSSCRRALTGSSPRGSHAYFAYYHCFNRACPLRYKNIPKGEIEGRFLDLMGSLAIHPGFENFLIETMTAYEGERVSALGAAELAQQAAIKSLKAQRTKVFELAEAGVYDARQAKERLATVELQVESAELAAQQIPPVLVTSAQSATSALQAIEYCLANWFSLPPEQRSSFQKLVFPERLSYVRNEGFGTTKVGLIFELNQSFEHTNSVSVRRMRLHWNEVVGELNALSALRLSGGPHRC